MERRFSRQVNTHRNARSDTQRHIPPSVSEHLTSAQLPIVFSVDLLTRPFNVVVRKRHTTVQWCKSLQFKMSCKKSSFFSSFSKRCIDTRKFRHCFEFCIGLLLIQRDYTPTIPFIKRVVTNRWGVGGICPDVAFDLFTSFRQTIILLS